MGVLDILKLLGGLALFLFGMNIMSNGLEKMSSGRMEAILEKLTGKLLMGVLMGAVVTAVIQSSSATTVMVVGFVNAGVMRLAQAVGVIFGANIGTTATSFILSLGDISSSNIVLQLLKPSALASIVSIVGVLMYMMTSTNDKKHDLGSILIGFGILFFGMNTMESAVSILRESPAFADMMLAVSNPFLGVAVGAIVTAVIQSSSASVGILQALTSTGAVTFSAAAPIILGQNIGTCVTALMSSIGASKNARRAAMVHLYFNIIGTVIFLVLLYVVQYTIGLSFWEASIGRFEIAIFHLVFNVFSTALLLPFHGLLQKLAEMTVKDKPGAKQLEVSLLDERFLASPSLALDKADEVVAQMGSLSLQNFKDSMKLIRSFDAKLVQTIREREDIIDKSEVRVNDYLVRLTDRSLSLEENSRMSSILHAVGDWERIGDYIINLVETAEQMRDNQVTFTPSAQRECESILDAVNEIMTITLGSYRTKDAVMALNVEPLEQVIDLLREQLKAAHIERLKAGDCTIMSGTLFLELITNLERISDHCSTIAVTIIQNAREAQEHHSHQFNFHEYLRTVHEGGDADYKDNFENFHQKYIDSIKEPKK